MVDGASRALPTHFVSLPLYRALSHSIAAVAAPSSRMALARGLYRTLLQCCCTILLDGTLAYSRSQRSLLHPLDGTCVSSNALYPRSGHCTILSDGTRTCSLSHSIAAVAAPSSRSDRWARARVLYRTPCRSGRCTVLSDGTRAYCLSYSIAAVAAPCSRWHSLARDLHRTLSQRSLHHPIGRHACVFSIVLRGSSRCTSFSDVARTCSLSHSIAVAAAPSSQMAFMCVLYHTLSQRSLHHPVGWYSRVFPIVFYRSDRCTILSDGTHTCSSSQLSLHHSLSNTSRACVRRALLSVRSALRTVAAIAASSSPSHAGALRFSPLDQSPSMVNAPSVFSHPSEPRQRPGGSCPILEVDSSTSCPAPLLFVWGGLRLFLASSDNILTRITSSSKIESCSTLRGPSRLSCPISRIPRVGSPDASMPLMGTQLHASDTCGSSPRECSGLFRRCRGGLDSRRLRPP